MNDLNMNPMLFLLCQYLEHCFVGILLLVLMGNVMTALGIWYLVSIATPPWLIVCVVLFVATLVGKASDPHGAFSNRSERCSL